MALVFTQSRTYVRGDRRVREGKVSFTGATSYTTGGIATTASDYNFRQLDSLEVVGSHGGGCFVDDDAAGTVKLLLTSAVGGVTQIAGSGDPTGVTLHVRAIGF